MATWGSTTLIIADGSYKVPFAENGLKEIEILPAAGESTPATVLQQAGRGRQRTAFDCFVYTYSDYTSLYNDYIACTQRTFAGADSVSMTAIIESITQAQIITTGLYKFSMTILEV